MVYKTDQRMNNPAKDAFVMIMASEKRNFQNQLSNISSIKLFLDYLLKVESNLVFSN